MKRILSIVVLGLAFGGCIRSPKMASIAYQYQLDDARQLISVGKNLEAIEELNMLTQLDPDGGEAFALRGLAEQKLNRFESAAADYEAALKRSPNHVRAHYNLGMIYAYKLNERQGALRHFDRFLSLAPDHEEVLNVAKVMSSIDGPDRSLSPVRPETEEFLRASRLISDREVLRRKLKEASEKMPDSPLFYYLLGESYAPDQKAIDYYKLALEKRPTCAQCRRSLGKTLIARGRTNEGKMELWKADLFGPKISK